MVLDHIQFGRRYLQWMAKFSDDVPALLFTLTSTLLAGATRLTPRPLASGSGMDCAADARWNTPGDPDFCCAGYRA